MTMITRAIATATLLFTTSAFGLSGVDAFAPAPATPDEAAPILFAEDSQADDPIKAVEKEMKETTVDTSGDGDKIGDDPIKAVEKEMKETTVDTSGDGDKTEDDPIKAVEKEMKETTVDTTGGDGE
jgi:hypothetical protein